MQLLPLLLLEINVLMHTQEVFDKSKGILFLLFFKQPLRAVFQAAYLHGMLFREYWS